MSPLDSSPKPSDELSEATAGKQQEGNGGTGAADTQINHAAALAYWSSIPTDVNGMLGGYPQISQVDLRGSASFVGKLRRRSTSTAGAKPPFARGVDCGAGIGRVTKGLLAAVCGVVDLVEPVAHFVGEVERGGYLATLREQGKIGTVYTTPLEAWEPGRDRYDLMWHQWCLGHLTDAQLVAYLSRCASALTAGGWLVIKENISTDMERRDNFDPVDNSVVRCEPSVASRMHQGSPGLIVTLTIRGRTEEKYHTLFDEAKLELMRTELQTGFPRALGLYPVRSFALQPRAQTDE